MSNKGNIKFYKNPARKNPENVHSGYIPQYQKRGIVPEQVGGDGKMAHILSATLPDDLDNDNPRLRRPNIRMDEDANEVGSLVPVRHLTNVSELSDRTWSGVDGFIDDVSDVDINQSMIDNNDYVDTFQDLNTDSSEEFPEVDQDQYILLLDNKPVASGVAAEIEEVISSLIFGEHPICKGNAVPPELLTLLKKVKIKIGVFVGQ